MIYYAKWIQKDKRTAVYGKKLQNVEETGMKNMFKMILYGLIIGVIIVIIFIVILLIYFSRILK